MVEIKWSKRANRRRISVLTCGIQLFGVVTAQRLYDRIEDYVGSLAVNPLMGIIEPLLCGRSMEYRSLVVHEHYKLIYRIEGTCIYIVDLWDTRREPNKLSRRIRGK